MTKDERAEVLANLLEARAGRVTGKDQPMLSAEDRADVESLIEVADLLWAAGHGAPPLESDPVAAMLGLIPDPQCALDPKALARARKNARLKPSELVNRLVPPRMGCSGSRCIPMGKPIGGRCCACLDQGDCRRDEHQRGQAHDEPGIDC
jgi:hypothetical protein